MKAELPIVIRKASAYFAAFACPLRVMRPLLPHPMLAPVTLVPGKGALVVSIIDSEDTSLGPHREVSLSFRCRLRRSGPLPLLPLVAERLFEDVGAWVELCAASTEAAAEARRAHFGLPAFVADVRVDHAADGLTCDVTEGGERVLRVEISRPRGASAQGALPVRTYSAQGDDLLFTELHADTRGASSRLGARARLEVAEHRRTRELDAGALSASRPLEVRWFDEYRGLLDRPSIRYRLSA